MLQCLRLRLVSFAVLFLVATTALASGERWWKGNLHTHSLWSDGNDYPEMIVGWYKEHGYQFLALSDHNRMLVGERWIDVGTNNRGNIAFQKYLQRWGTSWVVQRKQQDITQVRLKTLEEFRGKFEDPGRFLLITAEEISDKFEKLPIHLNATNLRELIPPQGGSNVYEVLQKDINAVLAQRKRTGQIMVPHINHPNFTWALTAEDIMRVQGDRFLEIYNGHPITENNGDALHASAERIWDIVLTRRLSQLGLEPMWGTAVDDSHDYHDFSVGRSNPGRGWIVVWCRELTPDSLLTAMEKGDFYASSGVRLREVSREAKRLSLEIEVEPGVTYKTQFIGTRKGYDSQSQPIMVEGAPLTTTRRYGADIGDVLAEFDGASASYELKGDEIYVRAKVISSKSKSNPMVPNETEAAWTQPVITGVK